MKTKTLLIFSYKLLHSFLIPLGPQEKRFIGSKTYYWGVRDLKIVRDSIKMGKKLFGRRVDPLCLLWSEKVKVGFSWVFCASNTL